MRILHSSNTITIERANCNQLSCPRFMQPNAKGYHESGSIGQVPYLLFLSGAEKAPCNRDLRLFKET